MYHFVSKCAFQIPCKKRGMRKGVSFAILIYRMSNEQYYINKNFSAFRNNNICNFGVTCPLRPNFSSLLSTPCNFFLKCHCVPSSALRFFFLNRISCSLTLLATPSRHLSWKNLSRIFILMTFSIIFNSKNKISRFFWILFSQNSHFDFFFRNIFPQQVFGFRNEFILFIPFN